MRLTGKKVIERDSRIKSVSFADPLQCQRQQYRPCSAAKIYVAWSGARSRFGVGSMRRSVWNGSPDKVAGQTDIGKEKPHAENIE